MRMASANADPDNFHHSFRWKCSDAIHRQEERAKLDRFEFSTQGKIDILRDIRKETEREMDLIARSPAHAANAWIEIDEKFSN